MKILPPRLLVYKWIYIVKYRAFLGTMVNIERMHGWMHGWMDLENLKTGPRQNLHENVLLETV